MGEGTYALFVLGTLSRCRAVGGKGHQVSHFLMIEYNGHGNVYYSGALSKQNIVKVT